MIYLNKFKNVQLKALSSLDQGSGEGERLSEPELRQQSYYACTRRENTRSVGYGFSKHELKFDFGECKLEQRHAFFENFVDSEDLEEACQNVHTSCEPTELTVERVLTLEGIQDVQTIKSCGCQHRKSCTRRPLHITFHLGTPFETTVDVGTCRGFCHHSDTKHCQPARNKTITVPGPNGNTCMNVIDSCTCSRPCYRMSRYEIVYDYSNETEDEPRIMEIDVGQCVGGCSSEKKSECFPPLRTKSTSVCLIKVPRQTHCSPVNVTLHSYRDSRGKDRHMPTFEECKCI